MLISLKDIAFYCLGLSVAVSGAFALFRCRSPHVWVLAASAFAFALHVFCWVTARTLYARSPEPLDGSSAAYRLVTKIDAVGFWALLCGLVALSTGLILLPLAKKVRHDFSLRD